MVDRLVLNNRWSCPDGDDDGFRDVQQTVQVPCGKSLLLGESGQGDHFRRSTNVIVVEVRVAEPWRSDDCMCGHSDRTQTPLGSVRYGDAICMTPPTRPWNRGAAMRYHLFWQRRDWGPPCQDLSGSSNFGSPEKGRLGAMFSSWAPSPITTPPLCPSLPTKQPFELSSDVDHHLWMAQELDPKDDSATKRPELKRVLESNQIYTHILI